MGGLGDIARSLPGALKTMDVDIRVIIPYYKVVKFGRNKKTKIGDYNFLYGGKKSKVEIWQALNPYTKVVSYFLKNKKNKQHEKHFIKRIKRRILYLGSF